MQIYEAPVGPVVHADFYRLRGPLELENIGWDEAIAGAIAIVEWPERVAESLPADRLEVNIRFDPARGPDFRVLELRGFGTIGQAARPRARRRRAPEARRLERGAARVPAGRRLDSRLRAPDERRRGDRHPDDLAAAAGRTDRALRQALCGDRQALAGHPRLTSR